MKKGLMLRLNWQFAFDNKNEAGVSLSKGEWLGVMPSVIEKIKLLNSFKGACDDKGMKMLGWQNYATNISPEEVAKIEFLGKNLREKVEVVWLIGIGGSYLGARSVIESQYGKNYNFHLKKMDLPEIYFMGADTDPVWLEEVLELSRGKKIGLVVISKSGTTLEPALALRFGLSLIENEADVQERVIVITDREKGALKSLANKVGWQTLVVPDDIGGRYSVLTPVGLLPMVVAGLDIRAYLEGVKQGMELSDSEDVDKNLAAQLAAWRWCLAQKSLGVVEYMVTNSQAVEASLNWVMQLEPESEGHQGHGVHVVSSLFPRDLHSFGQLIQQGPRNLYEVAVRVKSDVGLKVPLSDLIGDGDGLQRFAQKKTIEEINEAVITGALQAHYEKGGVASLIWELPDLSLETLGEFHYHLMKATAVSGYMWGHNPFVQPGVQFWKLSLEKLLI